jgi:hypothetical protein
MTRTPPTIPPVATEGWHCRWCKLTRKADLHDPCLGELPGVKYACCGHGGKYGYIYFTNGQVIRFDHVTESFGNKYDR